MKANIDLIPYPIDTTTGSFYLAPANYFDSDVSMESTNAVIITASKKPGQAFEYDEYGVEQAHCLPPTVPPFEYGDMDVYDLDGQSLSGVKTVDQLKNSENVFRYIKVEL